jgi:outer membrane transport energization protein ExbB (TC 2.C.1.1.1)
MAELLFGHHDHHRNSTLFRVYHAGTQEVNKRMGNRASVSLSPQALDVVKASLDATVVRENQKLNSLMVLLTIAISGGPFLGLLGTVVGVMITFAAIAATGDVNVAAIAPGIAAALVATVAGLAVAIPALFGYTIWGRASNRSAPTCTCSSTNISRASPKPTAGDARWLKSAKTTNRSTTSTSRRCSIWRTCCW